MRPDQKPNSVLPQADAELQRDPLLERRYGFDLGLTLGASALGSMLLLVLICTVASRRLFGIRIPFAGRLTPNEGDAAHASKLLDTELALVDLGSGGRIEMTSKDESDYRAATCRPVYEDMWRSLSSDEQLLLHQLAKGHYANPENKAVIEHLLRRGYLKLAPWPQIVEPGFAEFIRTVPSTASFDELKSETSQTVWGQVRKPLLVFVAVIAILLMWLAGSAMNLLTSVLAGVATLLGVITQVTGFVRDKPPKA